MYYSFKANIQEKGNKEIPWTQEEIQILRELARERADSVYPDTDSNPQKKED